MSWENIQKSTKLFSVLIVKEVTEINKDGNESVATISYKIKFIDSARFMASSLSNLVDNLAKGIQKLSVKIVIVFLNTKSVKNNLIKYKCLSCNKDYILSFLIMISVDLFCY